MAYVNVINSNYSNEEDVVWAMESVCDIMKCGHMICGGLNMDALECFDPECFAGQFLAVQKGRKYIRRIYYLVISFNSALDNVDFKFVYSVGQAVAAMYPEYQSVFTVHEDKKCPELHIIFNNCSMVRGKENLSNSFDWFWVKNLADEMIDKHLGIIKYMPVNSVMEQPDNNK